MATVKPVFAWPSVWKPGGKLGKTKRRRGINATVRSLMGLVSPQLIMGRAYTQHRVIIKREREVSPCMAISLGSSFVHGARYYHQYLHILTFRLLPSQCKMKKKLFGEHNYGNELDHHHDNSIFSLGLGFKVDISFRATLRTEIRETKMSLSQGKDERPREDPRRWRIKLQDWDNYVGSLGTGYGWQWWWWRNSPRPPPLSLYLSLLPPSIMVYHANCSAESRGEGGRRKAYLKFIYSFVCSWTVPAEHTWGHHSNALPATLWRFHQTKFAWLLRKEKNWVCLWSWWYS